MSGPVSEHTPDHRGVIHDIGYRHHDGARLGRGYIRRTLWAESTRGAYGLGRSGRSKVMPMLLLAVMCLPAVVSVVATAVTGGQQLIAYTDYIINLQLVISIYVAGQAPVMVSRDLRFSVTSLYFSRPLERGDYVGAKWAAMVSAILLLAAIPLTILFVGALVAGLPVAEQAPDYLRSLGGAALLAAVLGSIGLVIAAMTPRRGLGVAAVITVLLVLSGVQAAVQDIARAGGAAAAAGWSSLASPFSLVDGVQSSLLGADAVRADVPDGAGPAVFASVAVLAVLLCVAVLRRRYRKVST